MKKLYAVSMLIVAAMLVLTACGPSATPTSTGPADLLATIQDRGYVLISTDPNYMPQSGMKSDGQRTPDSKCPSDTFTHPEMQGFDVDVANAIATELGVEACFATPAWDLVAAGDWADKWDMSVGSMTVKPPRPETFHFSTPYYAPTAVVGVAADSTFTSVDDLAGQPVCVATATTYLDWVNGVLDLNPADIYAQPPAGIQVVELPTDQECPQAIAAGRTEFAAYVTSLTVVDSNIADGMPVKQLGDAVFKEKNAVAIDKNSSFDTAAFVAAVDDAVKALHADGTLSELSIQWFGVDLTQDLVE